MAKLKSFYDSEIALIEHEVISDSELLEWKAEDAQWYLAGIHEMAKRIIDKIREEDI